MKNAKRVPGAGYGNLILLGICVVLLLVLVVSQWHKAGPTQQPAGSTPSTRSPINNPCKGVANKNRGPLVLMSITGTLTSVSQDTAVIHADPIQYHACDGTPPADRTIELRGTIAVERTVFKSAAEIASERLHNPAPLPLKTEHGNQTMLSSGQHVTVYANANIKFAKTITPTKIEILP